MRRKSDTDVIIPNSNLSVNDEFGAKSDLTCTPGRFVNHQQRTSMVVRNQNIQTRASCHMCSGKPTRSNSRVLVQSRVHA